MRSVCISTVAVVLLGLGPLLAADSARVISVPHPGSVPKSETLGFFATNVMTGFQDRAGVVPCFECVSGSDTVTMGVAAPVAAVESGSPLTIVLTGDDLSYEGNGSFQFNLISGGTTVMTGSTGTISVYPSIWLAQFPINAPAPGRYVLEGIIWTGASLTTKTVVIGQLIVF